MVYGSCPALACLAGPSASSPSSAMTSSSAGAGLTLKASPCLPTSRQAGTAPSGGAAGTATAAFYLVCTSVCGVGCPHQHVVEQ
eukprot:2653454-Amphidinium_carterae.1